MHHGMAIMDPRLVTFASRDGDLEMTIDASQDGDRSIPGWLYFSSRDGFLGWRSQHPWIAINDFQVGDR